MNTIFSRHVSLLLHLAAFSIVGSTLPALAQKLPTPAPGTTATSATPLTPSDASSPRMAQLGVGVGRATRGVSSYIGIGGNIGIDGDSGLGKLNFVALSKIGLTNAISLRPAVVFWDDPTILVPVTFDFALPAAAFTPVSIAPYIGGGIAIDTSNDSEIAGLLSGGIDVPLGSQVTATAGVNVAFRDDTQVGLIVGVGYNFAGIGF